MPRPVCGRCEGEERFVRLQVYPDEVVADESLPFTHPLELSEETWRRILSSIRIQRVRYPLLFSRVEEAPEDAFGAEEIAFLRGALRRAFTTARPSEWVVFGLTRAGPPGVTELTTGGWFVKGSSLHLILANHHIAATMANAHELLWSDPLRSYAEPDFEFVAGDDQTVDKQGALASWLLARPGRHLMVSYGAYQRKAEAGPSGDRQRAAPEGPSPSLEEQLEILQRLKDRGLITEEEYRAKKKELLDRL